MLLGWCLVYVASTFGVSLSHYLTFTVTLFAMTKTPGAMHVAKITTKRVDKSGQPREYVSHLLRRTYRDGARVKHETLANLTRYLRTRSTQSGPRWQVRRSWSPVRAWR